MSTMEGILPDVEMVASPVTVLLGLVLLAIGVGSIFPGRRPMRRRSPDAARADPPGAGPRLSGSIYFRNFSGNCFTMPVASASAIMRIWSCPLSYATMAAAWSLFSLATTASLVTAK